MSADILKKVRNLLIFLSIVFLITGVAGLRMVVSRSASCTEEITAEVVNLREERGGRSPHKYVSHYRCVYGFEYDGKTYEVSSRAAGNPPLHKLHDIVTMHINPDDPFDFYEGLGVTDFVLAFIPLILFWICAFCILFIIKRCSVQLLKESPEPSERRR